MDGTGEAGGRQTRLIGSIGGSCYNLMMDVALKPELERFVIEQVKAGRFSSASDVLEAGLARLMLDPISEADQFDGEDLAAMDRSERQIKNGEDLDWNDVSARLRKEFLGR